MAAIDSRPYSTPTLDTGGLGLGIFHDVRPSRYSVLSQCLTRVVHCLGSDADDDSVVGDGEGGGEGVNIVGAPLSFSHFVHAAVYLNRSVTFMSYPSDPVLYPLGN